MKTEKEIRLMLADYPDSLPSDEELIIAVFMGLQPLIVNEHHKIVGWYRDDPKNWFSFPEYKTWNSLMPVLEKIRPLVYEIDTDSTAWRRLSGKSIFAKLEDVYHAVVDFIRWYNSQNS